MAQETAQVLGNAEEWVERYGDRLYRFALARVRDSDLAQDLVQMTFLAALVAQGRFEGQSSPEVWLIGILKHKILDHFRQAYRQNSLEEFPELEQLIQEQFERGHWCKEVQEWQLSPESLLEKQELQAILWKCIEALPSKMKALFILREVDGATTTELCQALEISVTNFSVLLHRARHKLRECFSECGISALS